ncbi:PAS domain-containing protein [Cystobacter fuscus]|uniref:PAS domain-containing protein n=1 Tax=Cystobacter fuscus TaxID=43 RepID=UPI002B29A6F8|nr:PAS domain-containing protein [Cystobacter fuscus]
MDATPPQRPGSPPPQGPPSRSPGGPALPALAGYAAALLSVVLIAGLFLRSSHALTQASFRLARTLDFINEADHLISLVKDAEANQRGYLLLREERGLAAYEEARRLIEPSLDRLRSLAPDDPRQRERLDRMASLIQREFASMDRPLALMRAGKPEAALQALRVETSQRGMDELWTVERMMDQEEERRLAGQNAELVRASEQADLIVLGGSGFLLAFLGIAAFSSRRDMRLREREQLERERARAREHETRMAAEGERQRLYYQRIILQVPAAVGLFRASDLRCELANPALVKLYGGRELEGRTVRDVHAELPGGRLVEMFNTVLNSGQPYTTNGYRLVLERAADGRSTESFVNLTYQPLQDARGQVDAVLLFAVEVTEQVGARRAAEEALSQRQRAETALRENEAYLRRTLKASDVGSWEADLRTRRVVWSPQAEAMSGMAPHSFPGTVDAFLALVHPEDREPLAQRLAPSSNDPGEFRLEYRVLRADGGIRWHENRGRLLFDDAGQPVKLAGVLLDITPRKLAEQSQRESENRFRILAETLPQLIWMSRADGAAEYFNPRWYEYTGQTPEQARGDGWMRALHPDDVAPTLGTMRRAVASGEPYVVEHRLRRGTDAAYRWFITRGLALRDSAGNCTHWIGTCTDIDDQKRGTESLRFLSEMSGVLATSLEHAETLRQVARLAVPTLADWCIVDVMDEENRLERVEVAHADPALADLADTLRRFPPRLPSPGPASQTARTDQTIYLAEVTGAHLQGYTRDAEHLRVVLSLKLRSVVSVPLLARGRTLGVLTFCTTSLSGRRYERGDVLRLEEVAHRAALAIDNARLFSLARTERERAEAANRLKDEFLATVSHELRTPLTAMIGWLKLLRDGRLPPAKHARALETVDRNAHAQAQLIEDLLDVSRIVSGKLRLEPQPVHLAGIIQAAMESMRPAAEAKGMHLNAELDTRDDVVMGDAARLQQVAWNLLSNAVKFSPGDHNVWVRLRREGGAMELTVEDEGPGIPEEFLPHLFERFRRLEGGSTRQHGGLGLGLAIVRHLVELHGGTVHATSRAPGQGALFTVRLPPAPSSLAPEASGSPAPSSTPTLDTNTWPALAGRHILVVDDQDDSREMLRLVMEDHGARVSTAASAQEALRVLVAERPELLVSDIGMPGEDGYALINRVRALPPAEGGTIAAVALTAYARIEDRARALTAGFDMHVSKPVEPDELLSVLSNLVALSPRG